MRFEWAKGHGTENDFVLLPDADGARFGELDAGFVAALCDRRRGIGADGVIRVIRSAAAGFGTDAPDWFMDYRNADGGVSEMCGNGVRVLGRYLVEEGLVDPAEGDVAIQTRAGVKTFRCDGDRISVDIGPAEIVGTSTIAANGISWKAHDVRTGNPHAVVFVDSLDEAGPLAEAPEYDRAEYPDGVNVEFVRRLADDHVAMRVHERGSGETRSCGTGACAAAVAHLGGPGSARVDVPGGSLWVDWAADGTVTLTGPAVIVARGTMAFGEFSA